MTYRPRRSCKRCGRDRDQVGGLSHRGNCHDCGQAAMLDNMADLAAHQGLYWHHWLDRLSGAVARLYGEAVPLDGDAIAADLDILNQEAK